MAATEVKAAILASILKRCKANAAAGGGWGQGDSLGVLADALAASSCSAEEQAAIIGQLDAHKLFNPSQAHARFASAELALLPKAEKKRSGATASALADLKAALLSS